MPIQIIMSIELKTKNVQNIITNFKNYDDIIDLSSMNLFDAAKNIILISTYYFSKNPTRKIKYKVSSPKIKEILKDIPINNSVELI